MKVRFSYSLDIVATRTNQYTVYFKGIALFNFHSSNVKNTIKSPWFESTVLQYIDPLIYH